MKGIILAGGSGSRLAPMTKVINKHLLPIYDEPMIFYPIKSLVKAGVDEIMIITSANFSQTFKTILGTGEEFGCKFTYGIQENFLGIADALSKCEDFSNGENIAVVLGDNIFFDEFDFSNFKNGAEIFIKKVYDPERFGVVEIDDKLNVIGIEEKPSKPKSSFAQTGLYLYDKTCFEKIKTLEKSPRGEYEITDLNNIYLKEKTLKASLLKYEWTDAGTYESLFQAGVFMRKFKKLGEKL